MYGDRLEASVPNEFAKIAWMHGRIVKSSSVRISVYVTNLLPMSKECKREGGIVLALAEYVSLFIPIENVWSREESRKGNSFFECAVFPNGSIRMPVTFVKSQMSFEKLNINWFIQLEHNCNQMLAYCGGTSFKLYSKRVPIHMHEIFQARGENTIGLNENYQINS